VRYRGAVRRATLIGLLAVAAPARAEIHLELVPSLSAGAGWDSNLYLDAHLVGTTAPVDDGFVQIVPRLYGALAARHLELSLAYDLDARITFSHGQLLDHLARLELAARAHPVVVGAAAVGEAYQLGCLDGDPACHPEDSFLLGGGDAFLTVAAGHLVRLGASYRADARAYPDRSQLDVEQRALAWLAVAEAAPLPRWRGELRALYLHVGSDAPSADLDRVRGELQLSAQPWRRVRAQLGYDLAWQSLPSPADGLGPRVDLVHHGFALLAVRLVDWLEAFAHLDLLGSFSQRASGEYDRLQVIAGLSAHGVLAHTAARAPTLAPEPLPGRVRFRARFPGAAAVAVVGDWSGWRAEPLAPVGGGEFAGEIAVPPGRHRYALSVDGKSVRPPDAPGYAPDGFGGIDGVIEVPPR
jgi:hypothetical protein